MSPDVQPLAAAGTLSLRAPPAPRPPPVTTRRGSAGRRRETWATRAVVIAAAVGGAVTEVEPSGTGWADRVMAAGFLAVLAASGTTARRWTWCVAAGAALGLADGHVALSCGGAALVIVLVSAGPVRPAPAAGAAVGGLTGMALLRAADPAFHGASALLVVAAVSPLVVSGYRNAGHRTRQRARRATAALVLGVVAVGSAYAVAAERARPTAERGIELLRSGMEAARDGDDQRATELLDDASRELADADRQLDAWYAGPAKLLPVVGHNVRAADIMVSSAASAARDGSDIAVDADVQALTVQDGRLDLDWVQALSRPLDRVTGVLASADDALGRADNAWLIPPLAHRLDRVQEEVATARPDVDLAADAVRVIPGMFGEGRASRWLVAFVTPVEARGRTGLMGNFAELTATDGAVTMTRFGRAAELEAGGMPGPERTLSGPDDYLARWARFAPSETWRNITMSPDFPSVGQAMVELYPQSGGTPVDGVIAVDPVGLAALMTFTGPIEVPERAEALTPDTAAAFLLRDQYVTVDSNAARLDTLESLARGTFDRLTTGDLPSPATVADTLGPAVRDGHLNVYAVDDRQQQLLEDLGLDGALPDVRGDSFGVVVNNAVGNKVDLFLHRSVAYDVRWDPDTGDIAATATVTLTNSAPGAGLPPYVIGSPLPEERRPPPGTNRTYLSVYSPWALDGARLDGEEVGVERQLERGRYAYSLFLDIPPDGGMRTLTLELRGRAGTGDSYALDMTTQPLVQPDDLTLAVEVAGDGAIRAERPLVVDGRRVTVTEPLSARSASYRIEVDSR